MSDLDSCSIHNRDKSAESGRGHHYCTQLVEKAKSKKKKDDININPGLPCANDRCVHTDAIKAIAIRAFMAPSQVNG